MVKVHRHESRSEINLWSTPVLDFRLYNKYQDCCYHQVCTADQTALNASHKHIRAKHTNRNVHWSSHVVPNAAEERDVSHLNLSFLPQRFRSKVFESAGSKHVKVVFLFEDENIQRWTPTSCANDGKATTQILY